MRFTKDDIDAMSLGSLVLGGGGAGDPYLIAQMLKNILSDGRAIDVISLQEQEADFVAAPFALVGSPYALEEKLVSTADISTLFEGESLRDKTPNAVMPYEMAGPNALYPLAAAAHLNVPVIDADFLGRGLSSLDTTMVALAEVQPDQHIICDTKGRTVTLKTTGSLSLESLIRPMVETMGWLVALSTSSLNKKFLQKYSLQGSVSRCLEIGRAFAKLPDQDMEDAKETLHKLGGTLIDSGRVVERVSFPDELGPRASLVLQLDGSDSPMLRIEQRNEFHLVVRDGEIVTSVPDIIVLADRDTWAPLTSEEVDVQRDVHVIALPAHPRWYKPKALNLVGPRSFGYQVDYVSFDTSNGGALNV